MEDAVHYLDVSGNLQCIKDAAANFQFMLKVCLLFNNSLFLIHLWLRLDPHDMYMVTIYISWGSNR